MSVYILDCIVHIVAYKRQSVDRAGGVKVLLTTTVGLCTLALISFSPAHICLTCARLLVEVGRTDIVGLTQTLDSRRIVAQSKLETGGCGYTEVYERLRGG